VDARQTLPTQQPLAQEAAVQRHWPPTHSVPAPHGALLPHRQAPAAQRSAVTPLHTGPAPQAQAPAAEQPSAVAPQAAQAEPGAPHEG
jgi:hypothetical protein